ncbi:acyl-CoA dehydrogenase family protein [Streptomyces sp. NBC_01317]|uniref:acyl-CoA dehydrogenase family protein n=1 Tax=Streptomyces sp. NBC_01317 TaxID=2903822 RepID=UPI002E123B84|nr:acyl-CoA dehydrogenase family protein [Streptomyces sp. NBC_01317]
MTDPKAFTTLDPGVEVAGRPSYGGLTSGERALVSAAAELVPLLRDNADRADRDRKLPEENIAALREAGLLRLSVPAAYGGHAAGMRTLLAVLEELGRGCASTAWVLSIFYSGGVFAGLLGDPVRQRIWAGNPDATLCGVIGVPVPVRTVDGGLVLDGQWGWASGLHHADWIGLDVVTERGGAPERGVALLTTAELSTRDTWHMAGMRGTGSDSVVAEEVFVPEERFLSFSRSATGAYRRGGEDEALTRTPFPEGLMVPFIGSLLGMGRAVYEQIVDKLKGGRPVVSAASLHARAVDAPGVQANVADAATLIDSAVLQAGRAADDIDWAARTGVALTPVVQARLRVDISFAARQIRQAVDLLLDVGGASRFDLASPVQRIWRDLGTASRHPAFTAEINRERYSRLLLGID